MIGRIGLLVVAVSLLGMLIPPPASAHTRSWIGTDLTITYQFRTRGGTGFAVTGFLEVTNKAKAVRTIVCTLNAARTSEVRAEDVLPGESSDLGFFMSTWRMRQNPSIDHCHRGWPIPDPVDPVAFSRRI